MTKAPTLTEVSLGTVEVSLFETSASFARSRTVVADVQQFLEAARKLASESPALRVEPSEKRTELSFHVSGFSRWKRRMSLQWSLA